MAATLSGPLKRTYTYLVCSHVVALMNPLLTNNRISNSNDKHMRNPQSSTLSLSVLLVS